MLDDCDDANPGHHGNTYHLEPDVEPLHGSIAGEQTALILLQAAFVLCLESTGEHHMIIELHTAIEIKSHIKSHSTFFLKLLTV